MADETQILTVADDGTTASLSNTVTSNQTDLIHGLTVPGAEQTLLATIQNQVTSTSQSSGTDVMSTSEAASNLIHLASLGIPPQQQQQIIIAAHQHMLQQIQAGLAATSTNGPQDTASTVTSGSFSHSSNVYQQPQAAMIVTPSGQNYYPNQPQLGLGQQIHTRHPSEVEGRPIAHPGTRASPTTVQWLLDNYETAEGVSLPRSLLYSHYMRHCTTSKIEPVNAASFGKLIRSVFIGLKTRRLGTR
jgi:hypothetical protein